jgi:hypothetical protein
MIFCNKILKHRSIHSYVNHITNYRHRINTGIEKSGSFTYNNMEWISTNMLNMLNILVFLFSSYMKLLTWKLGFIHMKRNKHTYRVSALSHWEFQSILLLLCWGLAAFYLLLRRRESPLYPFSVINIQVNIIQ